ncbi:MAG TPA: LLM class F420-dependent oxidoreductase [Acidimicrobiia bacterium]|nr:LLM class F420-dependent oxidoreductase [Acidimicrobiia bacterium]
MTHIGLQIPGHTFPVPDEDIFDTIAGIAARAEEVGFDSVWVMDHFEQLFMLGGVDEPILEGYTTLAGLAARTSRVQLGTLVTGVTYRNPALLAKMVTTLDLISRGRAILGIGAAWFDEEHQAYGYGPLLPVRERMDRLEEAVQICRLMFTEKTPSFDGTHYSIKEVRNLPLPVQPGGPRIMIGGSGEKRTLRLVAQYADMANVFGTQPEVIRHKVEVLEKHCGEVGRDRAEITVTGLVTVVTGPTTEIANARKAALLEAFNAPEEVAAEFAVIGTPDEVTEKIAALRGAGLDGVIVNLGREDAADLETVAVAGAALRAAFS